MGVWKNFQKIFLEKIMKTKGSTIKKFLEVSLKFEMLYPLVPSKISKVLPNFPMKLKKEYTP